MSTRSAHRGRLVATAPVSDRAYSAFEELEGRDLNFDPISFDEAAADSDWHQDDRSCPLPAENPGPPDEDGSFAAARDLLVDYRFADPSKVRAVYDPASDLEGRDMLLVGRFAGMRFHMGVRIGGVDEQHVDLDGRPAHRFRWHYRTLEGHLERGHMEYELVKWTDTGQVEFRIRAYSQRARIDNAIVRVGYILFGRTVQLRFYNRSLDRMRELVAERTTP